MRIMVMGAGALGGYFGARLQDAGHDVTYVARGAHLDAMQRDGLTVESPLGDLRFPRVRAVGSPADAGPADVVLFMVKNYDVATAAEALAPALGAEARVVTAQNGVWAQDHLADRLGVERVLPGAIYMPADIKSPGVIRHSAEFHRIVFGPLAGQDRKAAEIASAIRATGIDVTLADDIRRVLWEKFVMMSANAAITALTRLDIGPIRDTPRTRELLRQLIDETARIARASHGSVPETVADDAFAFLTETVPPTMHASMLDDLLRGRRLELDWLSGDVVRRGQALDLPTPAHDFAQAVLAPFADGQPGA